jgi:hypothetical protein
MLPIFQTYHPCLACLAPYCGNLCFAPIFVFRLSDGSFYTASEAVDDEKQLHVASCCRCVASGKGQRNPCKMGLVAVLPIFRTSIY